MRIVDGLALIRTPVRDEAVVMTTRNKASSIVFIPKVSARSGLSCTECL